MMRNDVFAAIVSGLAVLLTAHLAAAEKSYTYKDGVKEEYQLQLRGNAPVIDGIIEEAEWSEATQVDGFSDDQRRVRGYVLATKDVFYLAIRSQLPDKGDLVADIAKDNMEKMVFDDSIEFWLEPDPTAARGKRFQFMTNPNSCRWSRIHGKGGADGVKDWKADWETKSSLRDGYWHCEARIPLKELTDKPIAAEAWSVNLWRNWKNPWLQTFMIGRMFDFIQGSWRFNDEPAPVAHLVEKGNRFVGDAHLALDVSNPGKTPLTVNATLRLERDGGEDARETQKLSIAPGAKATVTLKLEDKVSKSCRLSAEVVDDTSGAVYFRHNMLWKIGKSIPWETPSIEPKTALKFRCGYFPSSNQLKTAADIRGMPDTAKVTKVAVAVREKTSGKVVASGTLDTFVKGRQESELKLPATMDGDYEVVAKAEGENVPNEQIVSLIKRQHFAWEGNSMGISDEIFPPFEPLKTNDLAVSPVLRTYRMNELGLWDGVTAKGREILAAPTCYVAVAQDGRALEWKGKVSLESAAPHRVVYHAKASCAAVAIDAASEIEMDGLMRVTLKLEPVANPVPLERLSLEIPLVDKECPLMHQVHDGLRQNYSGKTPPGEGEIWNSTQAYRQNEWLNAFNGYLWLGGAERGVCWFAENDKGWITAKNMDKPLMRVIRQKGRVTLRVDLVNVPGAITSPTELVFGLQASPTRPPLQRLKLFAGAADSSGPVMAWGSMGECNWKQPWNNRWEVIDKLLESKVTGKMDKEWFEAFEKENKIPKINEGKLWSAYNIFIFEHMTKNAGVDGPMRMYFEEMNINKAWPEYHVFQDEWKAQRKQLREYASMEEYRKYEEVGGGPGAAKIVWNRSALDYLHSLMNEWLKRGISPKWDNFYPNVSDNPWTSAAYETEDGRVQPAILFWCQRDYLRRAWNLLNDWKRKGTPRPIDLNTHMSTQLVIPWFTWTTCNGDLEYSPDDHARLFPDVFDAGEPYDPDFLLAQTAGRQVGVFPYSFEIFKATGYPADSLGVAPDPIERGRRDWGMGVVHEMMQAVNSPRLRAFGYGAGLNYHGDKLKVWNYWDDEPAFRIDNTRVKALLIARPADKKLLLILQSWEKGPASATVTLDPKLIGFTPETSAYEAFNNRRWIMKDNTLACKFDFPYETQVVLLSTEAPAEGVLFADNFDTGWDFGWDYYHGYGMNAPEIKDGALRFAANTAPWSGATRIFKWLNLPDFSDATLEFSFRIEHAPTTAAELLNTRFPADGLEWSKHGLSHSYVKDGIHLRVVADPAKGFVWTATTQQDKKTVTLGQGVAGPLDTETHRVRIFSGADGRYTVTVDGREVLAAPSSLVSSGNAFGIAGGKDLEKTVGALIVDDVVLRAGKTDSTRIEAARREAIERSSKILAGRRDELLEMVKAAFGADGAKSIRSLALFNRAEENAQALLERLRTAATDAQRKAIVTLLAELPKKQTEHVESMIAIGQAGVRVPEFRRARDAAGKGLQQLLSKLDADSRKTAEALIADLYAP